MSVARGDYYKGKNKFLFCPLCGRLFVLRGGFPSSALIQPTGNDVLYCDIHPLLFLTKFTILRNFAPHPTKVGRFY